MLDRRHQAVLQRASRENNEVSRAVSLAGDYACFLCVACAVGKKGLVHI